MSAVDIFGDVAGVNDLVAMYKARIQVTGVLVGGVPSNESVIRGWLRTRLNMGDTALEELVAQTLAEREIPAWDNVDDAVNAVMKSDSAPSVNGFKRDPDTGELLYETRCFKSALKEAANSAFPGTEWNRGNSKWNPKRKGLLASLAERVFVMGDYAGLAVKEPSRVEERIKHVDTPQGPRSAINRVECVDQPQLEFDIAVHDDFMTRADWARVWVRAEAIGVGADRGRSDGRFELLAFDHV